MTAFTLAQISDAHLRIDDDGGESLRAFGAAVRTVAALTPALDAVLISGDLVDTGRPREYERARELLAPLAVPIHVVAGNHDDREALAGCFGAPLVDGLVQYAVRTGPLRLVVCDTVLPGRNEGSFGPDRRSWLEQTLAADLATPTVLALHHPPLTTGIPVIDKWGLPVEDQLALSEIVGRNPQVVRVVAGHMHRTLFGALGRCGVFVCPSSNLQLRLSTAFEDQIVLAREPAGFALHVARAWGREIISHVQPVGDYVAVE